MNASVGRRIAARRVALDLRQEDLAKKVGVTRPTISYWETGNVKDMKGRNLLKLCAALGVTDDWLLFGDHQEQIHEPAPVYSNIERELLEAIRRLTPEEQAGELRRLREREAEAREEYERLRKRFGNSS
jgi:transcriptional regulator with XRE-family HTH domain